MSGVAIIRHMLANNANLIAAVPATRIMAGVIPQGTALPAISVTQISGVQRQSIAMPATGNLVADRVQVTVMTAGYPLQKSVLALVRLACPNTRGTVNGIACDSVLPDADGPDLFDPDIPAHFQSTDFIVRFVR